MIGGLLCLLAAATMSPPLDMF